jgi:hypothetical protein
MRKISTNVAITFIAVLATTLSSATISSAATTKATAKPTAKASPTPTAAALPPIIVDPTTTKTMNITTKDTVVFKVDDVEGWSAMVSNAKVLSFDAGGTKGGASFNPSVKAIKAGKGWVVLKKYGKLIAAIKFTVA